MPSTARKRGERIEARVTRRQKRLFERAAALEGRSLTDFVLASASEAALAVISRRTAVTLAAEDQEVFVKALIDPPRPNRALRAAVARYRAATAR